MRLSALVLLSFFVGASAQANVCSVTNHVFINESNSIVALSKAVGETDATVSLEHEAIVAFESADAVVELAQSEMVDSDNQNRVAMDQKLAGMAQAFENLRSNMLFSPENRRPEVVARNYAKVFNNKAFALPNSAANFMCVTGSNIDRVSKRPLFTQVPNQHYELPAPMLVQLFEGNAQLHII